jgi:hypothetical protein
MPHPPTSPPQQNTQLRGARYELIDVIGRGGMADVHTAHDQITGATVALKQLRDEGDPARLQRSAELFEREFQVLFHLAHPRVVKVHDYGVDGRPFYTMELLNGGDLRERTPMAWRSVCAVARDICSVLSLLHSRRLVYRDMSPRNVRLTTDGQAKVIDFGAMLPMGPSRQLVGTAAFCAPEAVALQALDGRVDLYSLGATLYFVLSGRAAYPAREFRQLRALWQQPPKRLAELGVELPEALDALVMQLMELDPALRPGTAGEVMERLTAIAGLPDDEQLLVSRAYLTTPSLVGREHELSRIGKKLSAASAGHGGAVLVRGESGSGRSRLLDATALEAKLAGATVLRADSVEAQSGDYGVARALCLQLLDAQPELATSTAIAHAPVLGHLAPALLTVGPYIALHSFADPSALRPALQAALREWFTAVAADRLLVLLVDDFERIDEPSAAFLALLAREASRSRLLVCGSTSATAEPASAALKLLGEASAIISLRKLDAAQSEVLLRSVFGDVPHVQLLALRLHDLAEGNPRDLLQLAQHLVDRGMLRYHAGAWALPASVDAGELPASMAQALDARVAALPPAARELAQAMALCPEAQFSLTECALLLDERDHGSALGSIDALLSGASVKLAGEHYALAQEGLVSALQRACSADDAARLQRRLARVFAARGQPMRAAVALIDGGEEQQGLALLVQAAEQSQRDTDADPAQYEHLTRSLPAGWSRWFELGLALCAKHERGARDAFVLKNRHTSLYSSSTGAKDSGRLMDLVADLARCVGTDLEAQLDRALPAEARLKLALEQARARHDALPERERVLDPLAAIGKLARTIIHACGAVSVGHDHALLATLPSLAPYAPLSPMLPVIEQLVNGVRARVCGRFDEACALYRAQLERLARPDGAGLDASYSKHTRLGVLAGLAMLEAAAGRRECLSLADELEAEPSYVLNAWITRGLYHAWLGQALEADRCRQRVELLRIQNGPRQFLEHVELLPEVAAFAASSDLMRVKQCLGAIETLSRDFAGWAPVAHYARGEYNRLRGDLPAALAEFEAGLVRIGTGQHAVWVHLAGGLLATLLAMGQTQQVVARGRAFLNAAQAHGLGHLLSFIRLPLAQASCRLEQHGQAVEQAQTAVDALLAVGASGVQLGVAYEVRAQVASALRDAAGFERFAQLCAEQYKVSESPGLSARYARLIADAKAGELSVRDELLDAAEYSIASTTALGSQITSAMEGCRGPSERNQRCLELLIKHSRSVGGHLFLLSDGQPLLAAQDDDRELPERAELDARQLLCALMREPEDGASATGTQSGDDTASQSNSDGDDDGGDEYHTCLLMHDDVSCRRTVVGAVVLRVDPQQPFAMPHEVAGELSRFIFGSGDVSGFTPEPS